MALSHSATHSNNYAVILGEVEGKRKLPIVIGGFEAQAIAVAMENMEPNRPLTHDLFKQALQVFEVRVTEVLINELVDGIFHAILVCMKDGNVYEIDSRTSDAIAMAVRFQCPIYTYDNILEEAGIIMEGESDDIQSTSSTKQVSREKTISEMGVADLENLLSEALQKEDYEKAAVIRDEINRRQS